MTTHASQNFLVALSIVVILSQRNDMDAYHNNWNHAHMLIWIIVGAIILHMIKPKTTYGDKSAFQHKHSKLNVYIWSNHPQDNSTYNHSNKHMYMISIKEMF